MWFILGRLCSCVWDFVFVLGFVDLSGLVCCLYLFVGWVLFGCFDVLLLFYCGCILSCVCSWLCWLLLLIAVGLLLFVCVD